MSPTVPSSSARPVHIQFFFFNDTAPTEISTLSLHDALPIWAAAHLADAGLDAVYTSPLSRAREVADAIAGDRKSTRLNSSHMSISYAVFCLKKNTRPHTPSR